MAGAGYRLFATGDVLTAAQVNTYLQQQTVMVFADSSARTTALSGVLAEGMVSYLQSDDTVYVYNGSAWVSIANSGDITSVVAGNGLSGGATSGAATLTIDTAVTADLTTAQTFTNKKLSDSTTTIVDVTDATKAVKFDVGGTTAITGTIATNFTSAKTITIPDATDTLVGRATTDTLTNKTLTSPALTTPTISTATTNGDLLYGTGSGALTRLGIGSSAQVLTVSGGVPVWATAASGTSFVGCSLKKNGDQSISNATWTAITFNVEDYDTNTFHDNSTNTSRITIPTGKSGKYLFVYGLSVTNNSTGVRQMQLYKNGSLLGNYLPFISYSDNARSNYSITLDLAAADYLEVYLYQNSGTSLNCLDSNSATTNYTYFQTNYLGA